RKLAELEKAQAAVPAAPAIDPKELQREREAAERKLKEALDKAAGAERSLKSLQAEVDAAKTDAAKARAEAARAKAAADVQAGAGGKAAADVEGVAVLEGAATTITAPPVPSNGAEIARLAQEVYESINDILSEMRNNMRLVQGELPNLKADGHTLQAVTDAVE